MSGRHAHRPADRDVRMHDPHPPPPPHHAMSAPPPSHPHPPPHPHINGSVPSTPAISNGVGHAHAHPSHPHPPPSAALVSPVVNAGGPSSSGVGHANGVAVHPAIQKLNQANEETWLLIGSVAEQMGDLDRALSAYDNVLRHNPQSIAGLTQVAGIARIRENYPKAIEYFQRVLHLQGNTGEVWSALGHCYLMQDDLQKAYSAYQQALYLLPNPKEDPKLWYGIGILYDRYGSLDHAEEAFASVLQMDKDFDKANEILFRLGIIYKQQLKYQESLECFDRILRNPPSPLAHADIWFQIGHVYEQQRDYSRAKDAYERVIEDNPLHAKVLQQLGWLYHQDGTNFQNQDLAIGYLTKSLEVDPSDAQSWYLLGRAYMAGQKYNKAYEAYQQAVYRDGRNPTFWCSIGVLYFQINQYRDALDAYSRAIRINPYISEVWYDLGSLYESCNNQISDAIDAYARAAELDPTNTTIQNRLQLLRNAQATGSALPAAPGPQDVHPTLYSTGAGATHSSVGPGGPPVLNGPNSRPIFSRVDSRDQIQSDGPPGPLPMTTSPHAQHNPAPFRGGPPPPVVIDDSRRAPNHTPLAPIELDREGRRGVHSRDGPGGPPPPPASYRDGPGPARAPSSTGPSNQSLLLHHSSQGPPHEHEHSTPHPSSAHHDPFYPRQHTNTSVSPPPHMRSHGGPPEAAGGSYPPYSSGPPLPPPPSATARSQSGMQSSPRFSGPYRRGPSPPPPASIPPQGSYMDREREQREREAWERRSERDGRPRHGSRSGPPPPGYSNAPYPPHSHGTPPPSHHYDRDRRMSPPPPAHRPMSPRGRMDHRSPVVSHRNPSAGPGGPPPHVWDAGKQQGPPPPGGPVAPSSSHGHRYPSGSHYGGPVDGGYPSPPPPPPHDAPPSSRRYDPIFDDSQSAPRPTAGSPEFRPMRHGPAPPGPPQSIPSSAEYSNPYPPANQSPGDKARFRRNGKDKEMIIDTREPTPVQMGPGMDASGKKKRRSRRTKDEDAKDGGSRASSVQPSAFKLSGPSNGNINMKSPPSPEPVSSASATGSGRSGRPSPPTRVVDEDYDEGVADTLMSLAQHRPHDAPPPQQAPIPPPGQGSPGHVGSHRSSISSNLSRHSSPPRGSIAGIKRPLGSPGDAPDLPSSEPKRTRVEVLNRPSPPGPMNTSNGNGNNGRRTPQPSSRPSPTPFRTQPSRSPPDERYQDMRMLEQRSPSTSTGIPTSLPLPPPPSAAVQKMSSMTLPPIATLSNSPSSAGGPSSTVDDRDLPARRHRSRSNSPSATLPPMQSQPLSGNKASLGEMMHSTSPSSARPRISTSPKQAMSAGGVNRSPTNEKANSP